MSAVPLNAPAAERNKAAILAVLRRVLPTSGLVLEIASGTGQHVAHFARELPHLQWQPSDPDLRMQDSILAWAVQAGLDNVRTPIALDVASETWPRADAVVCINMIHIAPWAATSQLMRGAARVLPREGVLYLYGPYRRYGGHTFSSNDAFDRQLRENNPEWGVRDLENVSRLAADCGFVLDEVIEMPANNLSVIYRRE
jgi:tRNA G46 methylase TrmB